MLRHTLFSCFTSSSAMVAGAILLTLSCGIAHSFSIGLRFGLFSGTTALPQKPGRFSRHQCCVLEELRPARKRPGWCRPSASEVKLLFIGTSCHVSNTQPPSDSCHACTYTSKYFESLIFFFFTKPYNMNLLLFATNSEMTPTSVPLFNSIVDLEIITPASVTIAVSHRYYM